MAAQLPECLAFYAAGEGMEYEKVEWVLGFSAATLDHVLRSTKIKQRTQFFSKKPDLIITL